MKQENCTIIGEYQIKADNKVLLHKNNLITNEGTKFILQRLINNRQDYINEISIGEGGGIANKNDTSLNQIRTSTKCNSTIDTTNQELRLTGTFETTTASQINEIGVRTTLEKLITHDTFEDLTLPANSTIAITYTFKLGISNITDDWTASEDYTNVYYTYDNQTVKGVEETDTQYGYRLEESIQDVNENISSFYYSTDKGILYIHTSDNQTPQNHTIQIKY